MILNTRIAPSPTGDMHIGTARTAYFNYLAARATGGKFLLRIDDTDINRNKPEYVDVIVETMKWLGLDYDDLVYQSQRFDLYKSYADKLVDSGWAEVKDGGIVFVLKDKDIAPPYWVDEISGPVDITADDLDNVNGIGLIKANGSPSYNFCSIIDDAELGINYVIRGVDHIPNTARQVILHKVLFGYKPWPKFAHVGLIGINGKPMSKRDGAASMLYYRDKGYDPDAMLNFMARMGWGPRVDDKTTKMLPKEKMVEMFMTGGGMRNAMSGYDLNKLESFDRKYKAAKKVWRTGEKLINAE